MRVRPHNLIYAVDDRPPPMILLVLGLQHVSLTAISLLLPLIVAKAAGMPAETLPSLVSFSMIAIAVATLLQAWRYPGFGAGYLIPGYCSSNYLSASVAAGLRSWPNAVRTRPVHSSGASGERPVPMIRTLVARGPASRLPSPGSSSRELRSPLAPKMTTVR